MNKKCLICNDDFTTKTHRKYCSTKCQHEAQWGILVPVDKKRKHQLTDRTGKHWHYRW